MKFFTGLVKVLAGIGLLALLALALVDALLTLLFNQVTKPEYQVRFRWKRNSVAIWDNRATQHYAVMDYPPCHRKMDRAGIVGDAPF